MSEKNDTFNAFDPTGMFKSVRDAQLDSWSRMMIELVNTDAYAQATGSLLDAWLTNSAPFRKALDAALVQVLAKLHLPTRDEVTGLAERMTHVELRLDDLDAKLDEILRAVRAASGPKAKRGSGEGHQ
jgi:hypothetical protein